MCALSHISVLPWAAFFTWHRTCWVLPCATQRHFLLFPGGGNNCCVHHILSHSSFKKKSHFVFACGEWGALPTKAFWERSKYVKWEDNIGNLVLSFYHVRSNSGRQLRLSLLSQLTGSLLSGDRWLFPYLGCCRCCRSECGSANICTLDFRLLDRYPGMISCSCLMVWSEPTYYFL